jgi:hypothetical protein
MLFLVFFIIKTTKINTNTKSPSVASPLLNDQITAHKAKQPSPPRQQAPKADFSDALE